MKLRPILLSVKRGSFRGDTPSPPNSDLIYKNARKAVLNRDNNTCQFCGFESIKNETHHVDDDHTNHQESNLVTACVLCHMAHHIAFAGIQGRGSLIYLHNAEIGQGPLNQLIRTLWIAEELGKGDLKLNASQLLSRLEKAEIMSIQAIGTSNPSVLGDFMSYMSNHDYENRAKALEGIYLFPKKSAYSQHIKMWSAEIKGFTPNEWVKKAEEKFAQWTETL